MLWNVSVGHEIDTDRPRKNCVVNFADVLKLRNRPVSRAERAGEPDSKRAGQPQPICQLAVSVSKPASQPADQLASQAACQLACLN